MKRGYRHNEKSPRRIAGRERIDRLAEHMANGGSFKAFAFREGMSAEGVRTGPWRTIQRELGWQAV